MIHTVFNGGTHPDTEISMIPPHGNADTQYHIGIALLLIAIVMMPVMLLVKPCCCLGSGHHQVNDEIEFADIRPSNDEMA